MEPRSRTRAAYATHATSRARLRTRADSPLARRLLIVTGKGGVGKSTIACALGVLAARRGLRTLVAELEGQAVSRELLGGSHPRGAPDEVQLAERLHATSIDPERALLEWLAEVGGSVPARLLASRASFRLFAAAAPGAKELVTLVKLTRLTTARRGGARGPRYDLVILDGPATGHALALLRAPSSFGAIARVGPLAGHVAEVRELLEDPARSGYLAVAQPSEMAVTEVLEVADALASELDRALDCVVVNGTLTRRFTSAELDTLASLGRDPDLRPAITAVRLLESRARRQQSEIARLRRRGLPMVPVPQLLREHVDHEALELIADRLARAL
jgi:anion-transporting  ArsA/GET3 family ATPase